MIYINRAGYDKDALDHFHTMVYVYLPLLTIEFAWPPVVFVFRRRSRYKRMVGK